MKVTWRMIYEDFKKTYPTLKKQAIYFEPYDYAEIKVWLKEGIKLIYNYDTKQGFYITEQFVKRHGKYVHEVIDRVSIL